MRGAVVFLVVASAVAAFVVRTLVVVVAGRRWPAVANAVDRWWPWVPLVVVALAAIWLAPLVGLPATALLVFVLWRSDAVGSPLRPRR
jgi:hypothetical protein